MAALAFAILRATTVPMLEPYEGFLVGLAVACLVFAVVILGVGLASIAHSPRRLSWLRAIGLALKNLARVRLRLYLASADCRDSTVGPDSAERLREAWVVCRGPIVTVTMWLMLMREALGRETTEVEDLVVRMTRETIAKPLEDQEGRLSAALGSDRRLTEEEFDATVLLFTLVIYRYFAAASHLVRLGISLQGDAFLGDERYRSLYQEHELATKELRRLTRRSDFRLGELSVAANAAASILPRPPAAPPPTTAE